MIDTFLGLDKNSKVQENEFADMKNITNDYFPALGNRKRRGIISRFDDLRGLLGGNVLSYVDDDKLYYDVMYYDEPFSPAYFPAKDYDNSILVGAHEVAIEVGYLSEIKEEEYEKILEKELSAA
jgi:hypothetical protein